MKFTIDGSGWQAAGSGLGNVLKAAALAPMYRQQAEQDAALGAARIFQANMAGNSAAARAEKTAAEKSFLDHQLSLQKNAFNDAMLSLGLPTALAPAFKNRLESGSFGSGYEAPDDGVGPVMPAPASDDTVKRLGQLLATTNRMYASKSNVEQGAKAFTEQRNQDLQDEAVAFARMGEVEPMNRTLSALKRTPYLPFANVGNTGVSLNKATGEQAAENPVLTKLFSEAQGALATQRHAAARASDASAGASTALRDKRSFELESAKIEAGGGTGGKPLTAAQKRSNEDVDAARSYVKELPRETIAKIMRKSSMDLTQQEKDILARMKKARTAKYGEVDVPAEFNNALGLDQKLVDQIAEAVRNPGTKQAGAIAKLFGGGDQPMTEADAIEAVIAALPEAEKPNKAQYVAAGKQRARSAADKNPATPPAAPKMAETTFTPTPEMLRVQSAYRAGTLTYEQARKKLKELGMPE